MASKVTNVVFVGLGGQGVVKASDIMAEVAFRAGFDIKKSELHGMAQRGGSVSSDVRFGTEVLSPMVPAGEADCLVVLETSEVDAGRARMKKDGVMLTPDLIDQEKLANKKSLNVAMLGLLSKHLPLPVEIWDTALHAALPQKIWAVNEQAFALGRNS